MPQPRVLVFTKTAGYRHESIPAGVAAVAMLGAEHGFEVQATEDADVFAADTLAAYAAVLFLSTSGTVLGDAHRTALESYVRGGGGFVGVHAASATEYDWPFYAELVGARFHSHPEVQDATAYVTDPSHPATRHLPAGGWVHTDEWYDYLQAPGPAVRVLLTVDESTYTGGRMGAHHPIAWCRGLDAGRSFYTALGHTVQCYEDPLFLGHVLGGIGYSAGIAGSPA